MSQSTIQDNAAVRMARAEELTEHLEATLAATHPVIPAHGILAGPLRRSVREADAGTLSWDSDNLHFPMGVGTLMRLGCTGIARLAAANAARHSGEQAHYLTCIARTYAAVTTFIARHATDADEQTTRAGADQLPRLQAIADNCRAIASAPPATFAQAVQLFWFVHCLRGHGTWSATIGRLDQHLHPFYAADISAGRLTRDGALEILCELWRGLNAVVSHPVHGLMNVMAGGLDAEGNDATNDVSGLLIDTAIKVHDTNPFLSVRIHAATPPEFINKVVDLQILGHGQGTVYSDEAIIPSLVNYGVPVELARNYANDGCTEITIDGCSTINMVMVDAVKSLELALFDGQENPSARQEPGRNCMAEESTYRHDLGCSTGYSSGDITQMLTFDEFFRAFLSQYFHQVDIWLERQRDGLRGAARSGVSSPLTAGTFERVLQTGLDPLRGGVELPEEMIFLGSQGTVTDALAAVRKVVFEDRVCTAGELLKALASDWDGYEELRQLCLAAPKFGNDDDYVDSIAAELVRRTVDHVKAAPSHSGKPVWPCLFNHAFVASAQYCGATPDGRRWGDPLGEHFSPTPGRAVRGPTAVIRSVCKAPLADCVGVAVFQLALSRDTVPDNEAGRLLLRHLIQTALKLGVTEMNTAIYDIDALQDAMRHPDRHEDLIVRVWGFSARFVTLCREMQEHIIARSVASG